MRAPSDMPKRGRRREPGRGRVLLIVAAVVLFLLATSLRGIARFYTDELWFSSLGQDDVFWGVLRTKVGLAVAFSLLFALALWINLAVAHRLAPRNRSFGPGDELLSRYQDVVDRRGGVVRVGFSALFGLIAGVGVSSQWREWLLFWNAKSFDQDDPLFGMDIGFYVFQLPFLSTVVATVFASLTVILLITIVAHYLNGGINLNAPVQRVTPAVKAHVSVLLGILAIVKAVDYWLDRYELTLSTRGYVNGAGYTDVQAQLPALHLLTVIAVLSAGLFIWNIRRRGWVLPTLAVGLWALVALFAGAIYPEFIQRFQVDPAESQREAPYIADNIEATREAMGLAEVRTERFDYTPELPLRDLVANEATVRNIRLLDPKEVQKTYQQRQATRGFYGFAPLDLDRYPITINGEETTTQVVLGSRELVPSEVPQKSWEGQHLAYTHGYGIALSPANAVTSEGEPEFIVRDVPVRESPDIDLGFDQAGARPQIYFGEGLPGYAIVNTSRQEIDFFREDDETEFTVYNGDGGVSMGSWIRKAAFALRFGDINPLISDLVGPDSRIIYERDIRARIEALAPFLSWDSDPYPVVIDGRIQYVIDGYTTSANYPYAERADTGDLPDGSDLAGERFNYVRNSVKATIDAYDGTVTLYIVDNDDPIVEAWSAAFPSLFTPGEEIPSELRDHFRYPQDIFRVQTNMWARYHLSTPSQFYEQTNGWSVAQDPGRRVFREGEAGNVTVQTNEEGIPEAVRRARVAPYYVQMRLPDESGEQFLLLRSYEPLSQTDSSANNLTAFMVAGSDPDRYGELTVYQMPTGTVVPGPSQVASGMESNEEISRRLSLLNVEGTTIRYGDLLLIPIEDSLLYVRPVYLEASSNPIPVLSNVIVDNGSGDPIMQPTLREALEVLYADDLEDFEGDLDLFTLEAERDDTPQTDQGDDTGDEPDTTTSTTQPPDDTPDTPQTAQELLVEANRLFDEADEVLRTDGAAGLDRYIELVQQGQDLVRQALGITEGEVAPTSEPDEGSTTTAPPAESTTSTTAPPAGP